MAQHPRKIHGIPAAGISQGPPQLRRALNAITRADNYCPECFEFRGPDAKRFQMHLRDEKVRETLDPQGALEFDEAGRLVLNLRVTLGPPVQQEAATPVLTADGGGLTMKVLPPIDDFTGGPGTPDLTALINELNAFLEQWRRAGYIQRTNNG